MNPNQPLPEPLATMLSTYFDVELFWHSFHEGIQTVLAQDPNRAALFKRQFADAIINNRISTEQYRRLTNQRFETDQDLRMWLRSLWAEIYGQEPIPGDD